MPVARVQTLDEVYGQSMVRTSFTLVMLAIAGMMALTLGMVGVYGVISFAVSRRRREIGVRLALGAARTGILRQFLGQGVRVSAVACLCGVVAVTRRHPCAVRNALRRVSSRSSRGTNRAATLRNWPYEWTYVSAIGLGMSSRNSHLARERFH